MTDTNKEEKKKVGRPTVLTEEVVAKLIEVFKLDATVAEACYYAGIDKATYYRHLEKDPDFAMKIEGARQYLKLAARRTIGKHIDKVDMARWYAERKISGEFAKKERHEVIVNPEERIKELLERIGEEDKLQKSS